MHLFKVCTWLLCLLPHCDHDYNYFYHLPSTINSKLALLSGIFDISNTSDRPNLVHHGCCVGGWNWPATVRDNMDCNSMARVYTLTNSLISYVPEKKYIGNGEEEESFIAHLEQSMVYNNTSGLSSIIINLWGGYRIGDYDAYARVSMQHW